MRYMRAWIASTGVSPPKNGRLRIFLSYVGGDRVLIIQRLAHGSLVNMGQNKTKCLARIVAPKSRLWGIDVMNLFSYKKIYLIAFINSLDAKTRH